MGIFRKKEEPRPQALAPPWTPRTQLGDARAVIWDLAKSLSMTDAQVRATIVRWNHAADKPTDPMKFIHLHRVDKAAVYRPWVWLRDVMSLAAANGEHDLVCAGLFWTWHWHQSLQPNLTMADLMDFSMNRDIPDDVMKEIARMGRVSAAALPADHRIVGDETGWITAGMLVTVADNLK